MVCLRLLAVLAMAMGGLSSIALDVNEENRLLEKGREALEKVHNLRDRDHVEGAPTGGMGQTGMPTLVLARGQERQGQAGQGPRRVRLLVVAGLEGTGHHAWAAMLNVCVAAGRCVASPITSALMAVVKSGDSAAGLRGLFGAADSDTAVNLGSVFEGMQMLAGTNGTGGTAVTGGGVGSGGTGVTGTAGGQEAQTGARELHREDRGDTDRAEETGETETDVSVLHLLGLSFTRGSGMLSYPNFNMDTKNNINCHLIIIINLVQAAGLDLRVLVLQRGANSVLESTARRCMGGPQEPRVLADNAAALYAQLQLLGGLGGQTEAREQPFHCVRYGELGNLTSQQSRALGGYLHLPAALMGEMLGTVHRGVDRESDGLGLGGGGGGRMGGGSGGLGGGEGVSGVSGVVGTSAQMTLADLSLQSRCPTHRDRETAERERAEKERAERDRVERDRVERERADRTEGTEGMEGERVRIERERERQRQVTYRRAALLGDRYHAWVLQRHLTLIDQLCASASA
ncbi:hypothetical protein B484DRAFT_479564 [Ochromonadaceae sp. CCMP2298]|nr:hypothetical protein B484DRAFT_479564 [Ochromonadaceae sp. CCMP2298]